MNFGVFSKKKFNFSRGLQKNLIIFNLKIPNLINNYFLQKEFKISTFQIKF